MARKKKASKHSSTANKSGNDNHQQPVADTPVTQKDSAPNTTTPLSAKNAIVNEAKGDGKDVKSKATAPRNVPRIPRPPLFFRKKYFWPVRANGRLVSIARMRRELHDLRIFPVQKISWLSMLEKICKHARRCANKERGDLAVHLMHFNRLFGRDHRPALEWPGPRLNQEHVSFPMMINDLVDAETILEDLGCNDSSSSAVEFSTAWLTGIRNPNTCYVDELLAINEKRWVEIVDQIDDTAGLAEEIVASTTFRGATVYSIFHCLNQLH